VGVEGPSWARIRRSLRGRVAQRGVTAKPRGRPTVARLGDEGRCRSAKPPLNSEMGGGGDRRNWGKGEREDWAGELGLGGKKRLVLHIRLHV